MMKYKDLKTGMPITCEIDGTKVSGKISVGEYGRVYICQNEKGGNSAENKLGYKYSWLWLNKDQDSCEYRGVTNFSFGPRTLYDLIQGDVVVDEDGDEREVLGVCGRAIFLSYLNDFDVAGGPYTAEQLERLDYTIKEEQATPKEVTMAEVCEKFGETVKIVKE